MVNIRTFRATISKQFNIAKARPVEITRANEVFVLSFKGLKGVEMCTSKPLEAIKGDNSSTQEAKEGLKDPKCTQDLGSKCQSTVYRVPEVSKPKVINKPADVKDCVDIYNNYGCGCKKEASNLCKKHLRA